MAVMRFMQRRDWAGRFMVRFSRRVTQATPSRVISAASGTGVGASELAWLLRI